MRLGGSGTYPACNLTHESKLTIWQNSRTTKSSSAAQSWARQCWIMIQIHSYTYKGQGLPLIYSSCKPPFGMRESIVNLRRSVTALDIVKICWLAPIVFPFHLERVFHVKSSCPLWLIYYFASFICRHLCNILQDEVASRGAHSLMRIILPSLSGAQAI